MMGAAFATLFSYGSMALLLYWQSRKVYPVPYGMGKAAGMMGLVAACIIIQPTVVQWFNSDWKAGLLLLLMGIGGLALFVVSGSVRRPQS
jgi:peptidoglycan biosynthesis protein MviN/MurJ (putative lipid II flippase)